MRDHAYDVNFSRRLDHLGAHSKHPSASFLREVLPARNPRANSPTPSRANVDGSGAVAGPGFEENVPEPEALNRGRKCLVTNYRANGEIRDERRETP
jgi:hypothetical protein